MILTWDHRVTSLITPPINKSDKPAHCSEAGMDHWPAFHCTAETVASTA